MAVAFEIRIGNLLPEFLTHALIVLGSLQPAGAIATGSFQAIPNGLDHFLVLIQTHCHDTHTTFIQNEKQDTAVSCHGGESGIRTHGGFPHHQFSRLAP